VAQIEASYSFFEGFTLMGAYRITRAMTDFRNPETKIVQRLRNPLQSDFVGIATASYLTRNGRWQFDLTGQFNGGGRMPTPCAENPRWDKTFPPFNVWLGQITKNFTNLALYAGVENIFDFRQLHPIIDPTNPRGEHFDATMIWGPLKGRKLYIGLRWNIPQI
jgi:outer membrane receptor protein involved in Fe transport